MLRFKIGPALLLVAALVGTCAAQNLQTNANQIRAAMDARDFDTAERLVRDLRAADRPAFENNDYDYLLARLAERRGALAEAATLYTGLLGRGSLVAQYALWHLASCARAGGDLALERQYLGRLAGSYPSSTLLTGARSRIIESLIESSDYRAAIAMLKPSASAQGGAGRGHALAGGRGAMARLGELYMKVGDSGSARAVLEQLIAGARDDYAVMASLGLDQLNKSAGVQLNEFDALRRARLYIENRHWPEAREHLLSIVERYPDSPNRPEALYQTGFTFYREDKYDEAIKWFERAHSEFPSRKEGEQGYYWTATALQKAERYDQAARRYSDFINAYPASDLIEKAYRNVVDCLRYAGKDDAATDWSMRIERTFSGQPLAVIGVFNRAKIELARGNYGAALALLTRVEAQPVSSKLIGAPGPGEAAFLRGVVLEQMKRLSEAANVYLAIPDERDNYLGRRATIRLQDLWSTDDGRRVLEPMARAYRDQAHAALASGRYQEAKDAANRILRLSGEPGTRHDALDVLRAAYGRLPGYSSVYGYELVQAGRRVLTEPSVSIAPSHATLAAELIFLGLYDEGAAELRFGGFSGAAAFEAGGTADSAPRTGAAEYHSSTLRSRTIAAHASGDLSYSMAVYGSRGDLGHTAITFGEPLFKSVPRDFRLELLPRDLAELIYPAPYRDALGHYGASFGIDPRLVLSLARQESRFEPSAKSPAFARGLLQFIPETALKLASEEKIKNFELDDVYNAQVAVRLAARYVSDLLKLFPNNPYAVAASYDSGEQGVDRWIHRSRSSDVDRFVSEIAIPETKDYVAKVMCNYWAYQALYTQDLKPLR